MIGNEDILVFVLLVFGILQIVLFFKIWGMTNDVKNIAKDVHALSEKKP